MLHAAGSRGPCMRGGAACRLPSCAVELRPCCCKCVRCPSMQLARPSCPAAGARRRRARLAPAAAQVHEQARLDNELLPLRRQLSLALKDRDASAPPPQWHPPRVLCRRASGAGAWPALEPVVGFIATQVMQCQHRYTGRITMSLTGAQEAIIGAPVQRWPGMASTAHLTR